MIRGIWDHVERARAAGVLPGRKLSCDGKQRHASAGIAQMIADRSNRTRRDDREPVDAYHCQGCGFWHVGRRVRQERLTGGRAG